MERQETGRQGTPSTKKPEQATREPELRNVRVSRTGKGPVSGDSKAAQSGAALVISSELRHALIAEAAYYRALDRSFEGGDPLQDWLEAEREIDQALGGTTD